MHTFEISLSDATYDELISASNEFDLSVDELMEHLILDCLEDEYRA